MKWKVDKGAFIHAGVTILYLGILLSFQLGVIYYIPILFFWPLREMYQHWPYWKRPFTFNTTSFWDWVIPSLVGGGAALVKLI